MIGYSYNCQVTPAAPFVHVTIQPPGSDHAVSDMPSQLDTGADITVIPILVVEQLQLLPVGEVSVMGFDGRLMTVIAYMAQLALRQFSPVVLKVLASADEPYVLLGRDVLKRYRIVLDGPRLRLEIG